MNARNTVTSSTVSPSIFERGTNAIPPTTGMGVDQPSSAINQPPPSTENPPADIDTPVPSGVGEPSATSLSDVLGKDTEGTEGVGGTDEFGRVGETDLGTQLDEDEDEDVLAPEDFQEESLESILPLSGKAKETGQTEALLSGECEDLLQKLGINTSSIQKLCSQTLYDQVQTVKTNFAETLNKYREKISEINTDINVLQNALLNDELEIDSIQNIENGINHLKEKRDSIMEEFKSLIILHKSISAMTDSIFEVRTDLLAALKSLSDKIDQGESLTPNGMDEEVVSVLQKTKPTEVETILSGSGSSSQQPRAVNLAVIKMKGVNDEDDLALSSDEEGGDQDDKSTVESILKGLSINDLDLGEANSENEEESEEEEEIF